MKSGDRSISSPIFKRVVPVLLVVVFVICTTLLIAAPSDFAGDLRHALSSGSLLHALSWRIQFYIAKVKGELPELSWFEVIEGTKPHGFITDKMIREGVSLYATVENPLTDPNDIAAGKQLFRANCAGCHGNDARGSGHAPSLARIRFSALAIYKVLRDGIPGTAMASLGLSIKERWQVIAFLQAPERAGSANSDSHNNIPPVNVSWHDLLTARSKTDSWLTYSGALDGWRHVPLKQITADNVRNLQLVWAHQFATTEASPFEATPLVVNKTIFITEPPNNVIAMEAATGRKIWEYTRNLPQRLPTCCGLVNRGLAILGNTLFFGTLDARLVAIEAATGKVKWETKVADPKDGFTITSAPLAIEDAVIIGVSGGEFGIRGFLAAYEPKTGHIIWRFNTIPGPGEKGHETWDGDTWKTGGGPTWITGSYDPVLNLVYWGVGNPSPNYYGDVRTGDNLFTDSVIALDAKSGKLAWYFQFTPHDVHDWDSNQTPILADVVIGGVLRKVICWTNRNGFYYVLDRTTGRFLSGVPFVKVDWASGLDQNGRPILTNEARVTTSGTLTAPWDGGGTNWPPPSFDPQTVSVLVPATEGSSIYTVSQHLKRGQEGLYLGSEAATVTDPENFIKALDAATGAVKWSYAFPKPHPGDDLKYSGVISTAGGVTFAAFAGSLFALDTSSGNELWHVALGGKTVAPPISFMLDEKQVVAITAGKTLFIFALNKTESEK